MRQQRDSRQDLLDAATEEFARHGLGGARVDVIVERAGLNERMLYHHFGSKVGVYKAVLASQFRGPELPVLEEGTPAERFFSLLSTFVRRLLDRPNFLKLLLHEAMEGWEHVPRASLADIPKELRSSFEAARRAGEIRKDCQFETLYLTAVGGLISGQLLAGRFADLRSEGARDALIRDQLDLIHQGAMP
jgi:AcrR family transcriptional regulator